MKHSEKIQLVEEYIINPNTMAVLPIQYGNKLYSQIVELEDKFVSPFKPLYIVRKSCRFFGVNFEARKDGTRQLTGVNRKAPITIDPSNLIYLFPTTSPHRPECIWISEEHIIDSYAGDAGDTIVVFANKQSLRVPISYHSFNNQMLKTALLKSKLSSRIKESGRKAIYYIDGRKFMKASERTDTYFIKGKELYD